jgi:hypothetical protein
MDENSQDSHSINRPELMTVNAGCAPELSAPRVFSALAAALVDSNLCTPVVW